MELKTLNLHKIIQTLDSSGIALLANIQKKMKSAGNKFGLLSPTNDIMGVLKLSSLDTFFTIYQNEVAI